MICPECDLEMNNENNTGVYVCAECGLRIEDGS